MVFGRRCFRHTHVRSPRGKLHFRGSCTTRIDDNRLRPAGRSLSSFVDRSTPPLALAGWDNYERRQLSPGRASTISFASIASGRLRIVPASVWAFPSSTEFITNTILRMLWQRRRLTVMLNCFLATIQKLRVDWSPAGRGLTAAFVVHRMSIPGTPRTIRPYTYMYVSLQTKLHCGKPPI